MWAPILAGLATLAEMRNGTYDMDDLADMLEALAFKAEMEKRAMEKGKDDGKSH